MVPLPQQSSASRAGVQNVHVMRDEVRADYERALEHVDGDAPFHARFARFFTELRDPLVAVYGDDPRFPVAVADAAGRDRARPRPSAIPSCAAWTTSARSPRTGCSASRRSATSPTSTASPAR